MSRNACSNQYWMAGVRAIFSSRTSVVNSCIRHLREKHDRAHTASGGAVIVVRVVECVAASNTESLISGADTGRPGPATGQRTFVIRFARSVLQEQLITWFRILGQVTGVRSCRSAVHLWQPVSCSSQSEQCSSARAATAECGRDKKLNLFRQMYASDA